MFRHHSYNFTIYFMRNLILIVVLFCFGCTASQDYTYFNKNNEYHYLAVYIDKNGDTITHEKMILKPLGRPWLPQPWLQTAIKYNYNTDTIGFKNYVDPDIWWHEKNQKYYFKKGKVRVSEKEITGAFSKRGAFYMHPPRINQYRMLFYSAHPMVPFAALNDSASHLVQKHLNVIGMGGRYIQHYTITPFQDTVINNTLVKVWSVCAISGGDFNEYHESLKIYDSTLDAVFTKEYGFVKLHYTFENGIKIQFDLEKVVYL